MHSPLYSSRQRHRRHSWGELHQLAGEVTSRVPLSTNSPVWHEAVHGIERKDKSVGWDKLKNLEESQNDNQTSNWFNQFRDGANNVRKVDSDPDTILTFALQYIFGRPINYISENMNLADFWLPKAIMPSNVHRIRQNPRSTLRSGVPVQQAEQETGTSFVGDILGTVGSTVKDSMASAATNAAYNTLQAGKNMAGGAAASAAASAAFGWISSTFPSFSIITPLVNSWIEYNQLPIKLHYALATAALPYVCKIIKAMISEGFETWRHNHADNTKATITIEKLAQDIKQSQEQTIEHKQQLSTALLSDIKKQCSDSLEEFRVLLSQLTDEARATVVDILSHIPAPSVDIDIVRSLGERLTQIEQKQKIQPDSEQTVKQQTTIQLEVVKAAQLCQYNAFAGYFVDFIQLLLGHFQVPQHVTMVASDIPDDFKVQAILQLPDGVTGVFRKLGEGVPAVLVYRTFQKQLLNQRDLPSVLGTWLQPSAWAAVRVAYERIRLMPGLPRIHIDSPTRLSSEQQNYVLVPNKPLQQAPMLQQQTLVQGQRYSGYSTIGHLPLFVWVIDTTLQVLLIRLAALTYSAKTQPHTMRGVRQVAFFDLRRTEDEIISYIKYLKRVPIGTTGRYEWQVIV